jgi:hypothetical protein
MNAPVDVCCATVARTQASLTSTLAGACAQALAVSDSRVAMMIFFMVNPQRLNRI